MTGTPRHSIKGNISVFSGATLNFAPATLGTVNLNGVVAQTISNAGTLTFAANSTISIDNAYGITLNNPLTINIFSLTNGIVTNGINSLTVNGNIIEGSATSCVDGKLAN